MMQRGRRSKPTREFLESIGKGPRPVASIHKLPAPPPKHLAAPERATWASIIREHPGLNRTGELLLENALMAAARARTLRAQIDHDGELLVGRDGLPRKHPLLALEVQARKLVQATFKVLKINYRGEYGSQIQ
jgi:hypothetical protein